MPDINFERMALLPPDKAHFTCDLLFRKSFFKYFVLSSHKDSKVIFFCLHLLTENIDKSLVFFTCLLFITVSVSRVG